MSYDQSTTAVFLFECPRCGAVVRGSVTISIDYYENGESLQATSLKTSAGDHLAQCSATGAA